MSLAATIAKSLKQIEAQLGSNTFTWKGDSYACAPSGTGESGALEIGGVKVAIDLVLVVRREVFPNGTLPEDDDLITYKGKEYRITLVRLNNTDTFVRLVCASPDDGV